MNINEMTSKEFYALPLREWNAEIICNSLIILPGRTKDLHSSGYRLMDFVAVLDNEPLCRLSGCSDVIHIEGLGGLGDNWVEKYGHVPKMIPPTGWSMDCLPKSGLLRMFTGSPLIKCGAALSSFAVYALPKKKEVS